MDLCRRFLSRDSDASGVGRKGAWPVCKEEGGTWKSRVDRVICAKDLPYGEKFRLRRSPEILHTVPRPSDEGSTRNFIYFRNTRRWFRNEEAKFPAWSQMRLSPVLACF
jgi:hypothetical protein